MIEHAEPECQTKSKKPAPSDVMLGHSGVVAYTN